MKQAILAVALLLPTPALADAITLDTSRSVGPTVSIVTPSGISCSETAGDRPSFWMGGRLRDQRTDKYADNNNLTGNNDASSVTYINSDNHDDESGWSVGVGVHIPFGGPPTGNCKRLFTVAKNESYILVLDKLLDKKAITLQEYTELVKQLLEDLNDKDLHKVRGREGVR